MNDMMEFFNHYLGSVADFLLMDPIKYFTGIAIGSCIIGIIAKIWRINK